MELFTTSVDNVKKIGAVSAVSVYGIGFFTSLLYSIGSFLGIESYMATRKMNQVKDTAIENLIEEAKKLNADGIMDLKFQMTFLSVMAYGTAYVENTNKSTSKANVISFVDGVEYTEVKCPYCNESLDVTKENTENKSMECPYCNEQIVFE